MSDVERAIQEARRLAATPEGKELALLLQQLGGTDLNGTLEKAAAGDFSPARQALSKLMKDPAARQLLNKLGGINGN